MAIIKKLKAIKKEQNHLLGIQDLSFSKINEILKQAKTFITLNKSSTKKLDILRGKTQINLFFEPSTRTQSSFELAGKRLGADVMSMNIVNSAIKKGETLIDTAMTLNAMHPDIIEENDIKGVVIGHAINLDGSFGKSSQSATDFAMNLSKNITIPIVLWDERLSSEGSFKITHNLGTNVTARVKKLDKHAAAFILQGAIDYLSN